MLVGNSDKGEHKKSNFFEVDETSYQTNGVVNFAKKVLDEQEDLKNQILKNAIGEKPISTSCYKVEINENDVDDDDDDK